MSGPNHTAQNNSDPSFYFDSYNILLECSKCKSPESFADAVLQQLDRLFYFDEAKLLFLDANGKILKMYSKTAEDEPPVDLMDYISDYRSLAGEFNEIWKTIGFGGEEAQVREVKWQELPRSEFLDDFVTSRGLKYSWVFYFSDMNGSSRAVFWLDRKKDTPFSREELSRINFFIPVLSNIYRFFFYRAEAQELPGLQPVLEKFNLTKREREIADMLCQGMSVENISKTLFIARTTAYKHISHIYEKLGVSSQQELLVKMISRSKDPNP